MGLTYSYLMNHANDFVIFKWILTNNRKCLKECVRESVTNH